MQIKSVWRHSSCSFFLINRKCELLFFKIDPSNNLSGFVSNDFIVGGNIEELIAQKYRYQFFKLVKECFEGNCFSIELKFSPEESLDLIFQLTFTPIFRDNEECVACTIVNNDQNHDQLRMLNDHSHFTSRQLRASTTNILSLLTIMDYTQSKSYDILKINQLLSEINMQAEKLDDIIGVLYSLLNKRENTLPLETTSCGSKKQHIVLVDDDIITSKIHQTLIRNQHAGKRIVLFDNARVALDYIKRNRPDLILLDLHMPEIDGFKFLKMLDDHQILIDVIILSSSLDPKERSVVKSYNFVKDFVTKPLTYEKVKVIFSN